jgi:hypothetical protein
MKSKKTPLLSCIQKKGGGKSPGGIHEVQSIPKKQFCPILSYPRKPSTPMERQERKKERPAQVGTQREAKKTHDCHEQKKEEITTDQGIRMWACSTKRRLQRWLKRKLNDA